MNIPLRDVQIIWDYQGNEPDAPSLVVMGHPAEGGRDPFGNRDDPDYFSSWGACNAEFADATDDGRLLMLFEKFQELVTTEGLSPKVVHEALCAIPEYRASLSRRALGDSIPEDLRDR